MRARDSGAEERFFRSFSEGVPAYVFSLTHDGSVEFANDWISELFGIESSALLGDGWRALVLPDDIPAIATALESRASNFTAYAGDWRLRRGDGAYRWTHVRIVPERDVAGRIVRFFGACVDVDAQRRAIEAFEVLAASDATAATAQDIDTMLASVARSSLKGIADIAIFDLFEGDGRKKRTVAAAAAVSAEVLAAIEAYDEPQEGLGPLIRSAMAARQSVHVPVVDVMAARSELPRREALLGTAIRSIVVAPVIARDRALGTLTLLRTVDLVPFDFQDVRIVEEIARRTALAIEFIELSKAARTEIIKRDERFHQIADAIPQLMYTTDEFGSFDWVNQRWLEYTGYDLQRALGHAWRDILHPDDAASVARDWEATRELGEPYQGEFRLRGGDGVYRWFLGRATSVRTSEGLKWYGTNTDIDDARRATRTLRLFADVGEALSESLELGATLDVVMHAVVPAYADWAIIALADESGDLYVSAIHHDDAAKQRKLAERVGKLYARATRSEEPTLAARERQPILHRDGSYLAAAGHIEFDASDVFGANRGFASVLELPLIAGRDARGTMTVCMAADTRAFDPNDVPFFTELARRIAPAIANAELYERERRVAQSFQHAALPAALPAVDGFVFSAVYEAGRAEALVGGDWYDAFTLLDGRIIVSIGDVQGSGLRAAVTMAQIRQAIRGVAHVSADPALMLESADRALRNENPEAFATAFVGVIDPIDKLVWYESAGHPASMLRLADNAIQELRTGGLPLGLREPDRHQADIAELPVGSVLYLYTDGLIESTRDMLAGEDLVREGIAEACGSDPSALAKALYARVLIDGSRDDVAILTVSVVPGKERPHWTIDAGDAIATNRTRAQILAVLETTSMHATALRVAEQIVAEVIGNLSRHAPGRTDVYLDATGTLPVLHVCDSGSGFEYTPKLAPDVYSERGRGLFLISKLAAAFNVTLRPRGGSHMRVVFNV